MSKEKEMTQEEKNKLSTKRYWVLLCAVIAIIVVGFFIFDAFVITVLQFGFILDKIEDKEYESLRAKEKIVVSKVEFSEEKKEELNRKLLQVHKNDMVTVVYFCKDEYLQMEGRVSRIDKDMRILKVVNTKIAFSDIYDVWGSNILEEY